MRRVQTPYKWDGKSAGLGISAKARAETGKRLPKHWSPLLRSAIYIAHGVAAENGGETSPVYRMSQRGKRVLITPRYFSEAVLGILRFLEIHYGVSLDSPKAIWPCAYPLYADHAKRRARTFVNEGRRVRRRERARRAEEAAAAKRQELMSDAGKPAFVGIRKGFL